MLNSEPNWPGATVSLIKPNAVAVRCSESDDPDPLWHIVSSHARGRKLFAELAGFRRWNDIKHRARSLISGGWRPEPSLWTVIRDIHDQTWIRTTEADTGRWQLIWTEDPDGNRNTTVRTDWVKIDQPITLLAHPFAAMLDDG